jgi:hypothetical protein
MFFTNKIKAMIIGSYALNNVLGTNIKHKDVDIIKNSHIDTTIELCNIVKNDNPKIEYLENPVLVNYVYKNKISDKFCNGSILMTLKISHSFWSLPNNSWEKHVFHISQLKEKGCTLIEPLFYELFEYWNTIHGERLDSFEKTNKKLMRTKESLDAKKFFTNNVKDSRDHDYLHTVLIKHPYFDGQKLPTYTKVLKDDSDVDVCMEKFKNLSEEDKFKLVLEELCIMASENRYPKEMHYKIKYVKMLKQFILGHCKVIQGLWIIQNYKKLVTTIPFNYEEFLNNN